MKIAILGYGVVGSGAYEILTKNGYSVKKVLDIRPAASLKAGGAGIRYTCRINRHETFLFLEENRWFVEEKCL